MGTDNKNRTCLVKLNVQKSKEGGVREKLSTKHDRAATYIHPQTPHFGESRVQRTRSTENGIPLENQHINHATTRCADRRFQDHSEGVHFNYT